VIRLDYNVLFNTIITGFCVGLGSALGTWIIQRHIIKHLEQLEKELYNYGKQNSPNKGKNEVKKHET
jgi:hypothetical protein